MEEAQPRMELAIKTTEALSGLIEAHGKTDFLDSYVCLICTNHTFGPAVVIAATCDHHFHRPCISSALARVGHQCPCRAPLKPGAPPVSDAMRAHRRMMDSLDVSCPQGCGKVLAFELLEGHVRDPDGCPLTPFRCGNEGCGELFLRRDTAEHRAGCPHRLVPCALCGAAVKRGELRRHEAEQCPLRQIRCPHCEQEYTRCEQEEHLRRCTGAAPMKFIAELREMMAPQLQRLTRQEEAALRQLETIAQLQRTVEQQQVDITQLRDENAQQRETIERQQRTAQQQQRQIAELQLQQQKQSPQLLSVRGVHRSGYNGEYCLLPERHNGAATWGKGECRIYKTLQGHWGMTNAADGPMRNRGDYRLVSQPGSTAPLGVGGWEYNTNDYDMGRAAFWEKTPDVSVTTA